VLVAGYLINRSPSQLLKGKTLYGILYRTPPKYEVIGSLCYAHNHGRGGDEFAGKSRKCVFMSYQHG